MTALTLGVGVLAAFVGLAMLLGPQYVLRANAAVTGADETVALDGLANYVFRGLGLLLVIIGVGLSYSSDLVAM
ncbi:hypothetical protein [Halococcoides cellulosivorans]|uniref:Uncharacterized protein n=1 Tax=Halococcoides cellulosivorans TaxID=1679096 RepID=A0A2R4X016_9EURY|nr:hypothetical protein [Halococcoides cellulosivorans]AWB27105.1 hypothetical protein HARCEL1_04970 [Halococcoides cellulosivorans]